MSEGSTDSPALRFVVIVEDNFHYQDADERYELGRFPTIEDAIATCERLVTESLAHLFVAGMSADELYEQYMAFGDDAFIFDIAADHPADVPWSACEFARLRRGGSCTRPAQR